MTRDETTEQNQSLSPGERQGTRFSEHRWVRIAGRVLALGMPVSLIGAGPLLLAVMAKWCGADHALGMDAARLVYAWPVIAGLCVLAFLCLYREPVGVFFRGITRLKAAGFEMEAEQQSLPKPSKDPRKGETSWEVWALDLAARLSQVDRELLGQLGETQRAAFNQWVRAWWFERIWGRIYGTQVRLIEIVGTKTDQSPTELGTAIRLFDHHLKLMGASDPTAADLAANEEQEKAHFVRWIDFVESALLVQWTDKGLLRTELTGEFLKYMQEQGYSANMRVW